MAKHSDSKTPKPKDFELWEDVIKTVTPLNKSVAMHDWAEEMRQSPFVSGKFPMPETTTASAPQLKRKPDTATRTPPPLTGLDRRISQRMSRGRIEIEAQIDLHGNTPEMARGRLKAFLTQTRSAGLRLVLVITGKGGSSLARHTLHGRQHFISPERTGVLRRMVPDWLSETEFRYLISGFQPAHPKHGGGGALYVRLRRDRSRQS